ncbi:MAG: hypothetical protein JWP39_17 [Jatrophihabitans sp.]|nr:hypothetical protein [Jatrophihabitans sp.]
MSHRDTHHSDGRTQGARYVFPQPDGSVWLGLKLSTLVVLGTALASAIALVMSGGPLPLAALLLITVAVVSLLPIADRTLLDWLSPAARHLLLLINGGKAVATARHGRQGPRAWRLPMPPECGPLTVHALPTSRGGDSSHLPFDGGADGAEVDEGWGVVAAARHRRSRGSTRRPGRQTVIFDVLSLDGVGLLDPAGQDTRLAAWGSCLDALAADARVQHLQWITHSRPDTRRHLTGGPHDVHSLEASPPGSTPRSALELRRDYHEMVTAAAREAWEHRHLLAVTFSINPSLDETGPARPGTPGSETGRSAGAHRRGADPRPDPLLLDGMRDGMRDVASLLLTADLLARPLTSGEIGPLLRLLTDPSLSDDSRDPGVRGVEPDPVAHERWGVRCRRSGWDHVRTDDTWHRSYTVSGWPQLPLAADWLAPLLHAIPPLGTARALAVHVTAVAPLHAVRQARAAAAKAHLDAADRSRLGMHPAGRDGSHTDQRAADDADALEAELAAGYRLLQTRAVLTISAPDPALLRQATTALRTTAATCRLDLRPLHGQHQYGLVATLPLGLLPGATR